MGFSFMFTFHFCLFLSQWSHCLHIRLLVHRCKKIVWRLKSPQHKVPAFPELCMTIINREQCISAVLIHIWPPCVFVAGKLSVILILHVLTKLCPWYPGGRRNLLQLLTKMQRLSRPCCRTNVMHAWKNKQHYSNEAELITDILMLTFLLKSVWFLEGSINFKIRSLLPFPSHQPHTRLNKEWSQTHTFCWDIFWGAGCRLKVFKDIYLCVDLHVTFLHFMVQ